jgi:metal-responsive CopG/Arc/MetJ family transcriptional regulator
MKTDRITIRLPRIYLQQIDIFIKAGDCMTRSEVIRRAIDEYVNNHANRILQKNKILRKVQELGAAVEALESYTEK